MNASTLRICNALWTAGNNAGKGYDPDPERRAYGHVTNDLGEVLGAELVRGAEHDDDIAVYRCHDGSVVLVGDSSGPWAVRVR